MKRITNIIIVSCILFFSSIIIKENKIFAQRVAINSTGALPNPSALLDVDAAPSNDKGLLIPRVSLTDAAVYAPITGAPVTSLLVYNTNAAMTGGGLGYWYWDGAAWVSLGAGSSSGNAWLITGNTGITAANFLGPINNAALRFRTNNIHSGIIDPSGPVFMGYQAGISNTALNNTGIGFQTLFSNTTGDWNTAAGNGALYSNTTGNFNTASGYNTLYYNTTGAQNTATGTQSLYFNTTGGFNTAYGHHSMYSNRAGINATAIGLNAMFYTNNTTTPYINFNVALGYEALYGSAAAASNTGNNNTALGYRTLWSNSSGGENTASGFEALYSNTSGYYNTASGMQALRSNTSGSWNTATGHQSMYSNTIGNYNTGTGIQSMYSNTTGSYNSSYGHLALRNSTNADYNTASGYQALFGNTTGMQNTAAGSQALSANTTGSNNTAVGTSAGAFYGTGSYNTFLGYVTDVNAAGLSNCIAIGGNGNLAIAASNTVKIGNASMTSIGGQVDWTFVSDERIKKDVQENVAGLAFINALRPVTYFYDADKENELMGIKDTSSYPEKYNIEKIRFSGFLAQEVEAAAKKIGYDFSGVDNTQIENGGLYGLRYAQFTVPLVKAVQELNAENINLKTVVADLKMEISAIKSDYENRLKKLEENSSPLGQISIKAGTPEER